MAREDPAQRRRRRAGRREPLLSAMRIRLDVARALGGRNLIFPQMMPRVSGRHAGSRAIAASFLASKSRSRGGAGAIVSRGTTANAVGDASSVHLEERRSGAIVSRVSGVDLPGPARVDGPEPSRRPARSRACLVAPRAGEPGRGARDRRGRDARESEGLRREREKHARCASSSASPPTAVALGATSADVRRKPGCFFATPAAAGSSGEAGNSASSSKSAGALHRAQPVEGPRERRGRLVARRAARGNAAAAVARRSARRTNASTRGSAPPSISRWSAGESSSLSATRAGRSDAVTSAGVSRPSAADARAPSPSSSSPPPSLSGSSSESPSAPSSAAASSSSSASSSGSAATASSHSVSRSSSSHRPSTRAQSAQTARAHARAAARGGARAAGPQQVGDELEHRAEDVLERLLQLRERVAREQRGERRRGVLVAERFDHGLDEA